MDIDSTASLVEVINAMAKRLLVVGSVVQTLMYEVIALWEPLKEIFIINIIHWNMKVMVAA